MAAFDCWAEYYDLIHEGLPGDIEFYVERAVHAGCVALEIGAGTGRIALPMAMTGVDVTALDDSEAMLEQCRAKKRALGKIKGWLRLLRADMCDFDLGKQFPFVAMPYRAFMHLLTEEDQRRGLGCVRKHLADDGTFILDTWTPNDVSLEKLATLSKETQPILVDRFPFPEEGVTVLHYYQAACDIGRRLLHETHILREEDKKGRVKRTAELPLERTWLYPGEMEAILRSDGFDVAALYGDFFGNPLTEESTESVWVLRKTRV